MRNSRAGMLAAMAITVTVSAAEPPLGVTADLTYATRYMTHGFNVADDEHHLQPSIHVETRVPGLSLMYWASFPVDRDERAADEHDILLMYNRTFLADQPLAFNLHGYGDYWFYPKSSVTEDRHGAPMERRRLQGIKYHAGITLLGVPTLAGLKFLPSYNVYHWRPTESKVVDAGSVHELMLGCAVPLPWADGADGEPKNLHLAASANYHDGFLGVKEGWSHYTAHASMDFAMGAATVRPSIHYQWSVEDTVNPEDEFWATVSVSLGF